MDKDEKVTLEYALEEIGLGEIRMAERFFGKVFGDDDPGKAMSPMETLGMAIWSRERHLRPTGGFQLEDTDKFSLKQANAYFIEPVEIDPEDPETDLGKDSSPDANPPESEPSSVLS